MIKHLLPVVFVLCAVHALRAVTPVDSSITSATVFLDRAVITRTAEVKVSAGEQQFIFERLPAELVDDSIQVRGHGSAQVTILEVTTSEPWLNSSTTDSDRQLAAQLKVLQKQRRAVTDRTATLDQQHTLLTQIALWAASPRSGDKGSPGGQSLGPGEWQQLLDLYGSNLDKIALEKESLDEESSDLDSRISALNQQLTQLQGAGANAVKTVTVRASAEQAGALSLILSYEVPDASWRPAYDARVSSADSTLSLGYFGIVRQATGEDWKGVSLALSTARPSLGGAAPTVPPWILAQYNPMAINVDTGGNAGYASVSALAGTRFKTNFKDVGDAVSVVTGKFLEDTGRGIRSSDQSSAAESKATSVTFAVPGATDVPSDSASHRVGIATVQVPAKLAYQSSPKLLPAAFLTATIVNKSEYPFLKGPVSSFLDGLFVATGRIDTVMPGEKLDLAVGVDDGIKVERKLVGRFTDDIGLVTRQTRTTYDVLITVTNNKSTVAAITIKDQIPVSRHEKIVVAQLEPDPAVTMPNDEGVITWALTLKPGEKRMIPLKFSIAYPKDFSVTGLE